MSAAHQPLSRARPPKQVRLNPYAFQPGDLSAQVEFGVSVSPKRFDPEGEPEGATKNSACRQRPMISLWG
jgi:hypothetical protein